MDDTAVDLAVLGAGVVGVATAYAAARRGLSVRIVERASAPALGASFANGGQLSYAYTEAMASPSLWAKLPAVALGRDPALRLQWSLDPDFFRWGLSFLRNTGAGHFQRNTLAVLRLALESRTAMAALLDRHPLRFDHLAPGKMHLYRDAKAFAAARAMVDIKRAHGVEQHVLSAAEAIAIEPALADATGLIGVIHSPTEEVGDTHRFCVELLAVLREQYGVRTDFDFDVSRVEETPQGVMLRGRDGRQRTSRSLVVCTGVQAASLAKQLGAYLPLMPMKGYSLTAPLGGNAPSVSITDTDRKLVFCRLGSRMRIAGMAEVGNHRVDVDPARSTQLIAMARESLPGAARYDAIESLWAGLRPMTPESAPIIHRERGNIAFNVGHGMLGWTLAMGAGERAVALLLDQ